MLRKDFIVEISKIRRQVVREGFGTILVVADDKAITPTIINDLSDLSSLNITSSDKAYKIIKTIFEQRVKPKHLILGGFDSTQPDVDVTNILEDSIKFDNSISFVVSTINEGASVKTISDWVENKELLYFVTVELESVVEGNKNSHTVAALSTDENNFIAEGLCSIMATSEVGSVTGKFKQILGAKSQNVTQSELDALHENGMITYVTKMGEDQTSEGITLSGEYIDVILSEIWIKKTMEYRLMKLALDNGKIPYDDVGIAMLVSVVNGVLQEGVANGTILSQGGTDFYSIEYVSREDTPFTDIGTRQYNGISWEATLTGAIHGGVITGKLLLD